VISGGFEGTKGHISAINEMIEAKVLSESKGTPVVLMIEPDLYIEENKNREPLLTIEQRKQLWSTSGKVDVLVLLPNRDRSVDISDHYRSVHEYIKPASWCASIENPYQLEVVTRDGENALDIMRLFAHKPNVHSSFITSTQTMNTKQLVEALREYSLYLAEETMSRDVEIFVSPKKQAEVIFNNLAEGLSI
jgi:hypothetical protein